MGAETRNAEAQRGASQQLDAATIDGITGRDVTALAEAYRVHGGRVYEVARAFCGDARAEDVTRLVFLTLWTAPGGYDVGRRTLASYLSTQAHSRAVEILRSDTSHGPRQSAHEQPQGPRSPTDDATLPRHERRAREQIVAPLPELEQQVIVLASFGGQTYRDIAELLTVSEATVKDAIRRGLHRLAAGSDNGASSTERLSSSRSPLD